MLSERQKNITVLLSIVILIVLYLLWTFVINKGTVNIVGESPFHISTKGVDLDCNKGDCSVKVSPHDYVFTFKKDLYFDLLLPVTVKTWKTETVKPDFKLIPIISKSRIYKKYSLPARKEPYTDNLNQISLFIADKKGSVKNIPSALKNLTFSYSGNYAFASGDNNIYLCDILGDSYRAIPLNLSAPYAVSWKGDTNSGAILGQNEPVQELFLFDVKTFAVSKITAFPQPLKKPVISIDPTGQKIIVFDTDKNETFFYLVDIKEKSKKKINFDVSIQDLLWSPDGQKMLIQDSKTLGIYFYDFGTKLLQSTLIKTDLSKIVWQNNTNIIFASKQNFVPETAASNQDLLLSQVIEQVLNEAETPKTQFISFNPINNSYFYLINPADAARYFPEKLEMKGKNLYFLEGEQIYEIKL